MSKAATKHFKTTNLDLACLLFAEGYQPSTRKLGPVSAEFVFERTAELDRLVPRFLKGECEVKITSFLYARAAMKRELGMKAIEWQKQKEGKLTLSPGQFYYFISEDGKAYRNVYANREPHIMRVVNGNAFLTLNEAQLAAAHVKAD